MPVIYYYLIKSVRTNAFTWRLFHRPSQRIMIGFVNASFVIHVCVCVCVCVFYPRCLAAAHTFYYELLGSTIDGKFSQEHSVISALVSLCKQCPSQRILLSTPEAKLLLFGKTLAIAVLPATGKEHALLLKQGRTKSDSTLDLLLLL